ncbi:hypothetical protein E2320_021311 [Naja naja]|nr:hypothetical protein E2320_021311 [Naja naja]
MCVSPLVSWIICTVMKQEMERGKDVQKTPYTLTVIYMLYLSSLLKFHYKEAKQDVQRKLKNVCFLAAEGNWKQQILFKEEDVKKHNLDQKNFIDLFLIENIFKRALIEFFAALYYVLEEGDEQYSENLSKKLQTLLKRSATSSKVDFVFHFLFGFLNEKKQMRKMKKEFGWKISPKNKEFILHWVRNNIEEWKIYPHLQKELFNYLYETQDDNFVKNAVCGITEIHFQCNSDMELMILSYCIQHCQNLENLCVDDSEFQIEKELFLPKSEEWSLNERYMEDFFQALTKLGNLKDLSLRKCSITESCSRHLVEIFKKNQKLNLLDLSLGKTDDRAVELLCEGLQLQDCKFLSESYSRHLAEVFRRNQRLKELQLWLSNPDDRAVELLLEGLQHPDCRIEKLGLDKEFITESCRKHLAVVLRKNQKLRELELNLKNTDDKIMEVLSEGLKHPKCKIETLQLRGEVLNETFSKHLEGILRKNQTLRELELTFKDTNDKTMEVLCEGLKHPKCKIEALWLNGEVLNESSNRHLEEVFRKNQSLKELGLFFKNPDGKTMEVLCERLKQPECKIETRLRELEFSLENPDDKTIEFLCGWVKHPEYEIKMLQIQSILLFQEIIVIFWTLLCRLYEGFLSEFSDTYLSVALRQNQRLIPLNLSLKNTDDRAMEMLHEGLQHSDCTLDKLGLVAEAQTESCSRHHAEVVGGSQKFKKLEFSFVNPNDKTMELLCEGLKDSQCKIEMLKIFGEFLTESNSRHLAEVLSKNHILRELELTLKSTDDKIIEVLCEGLQHPECKIEILRLGGEFLTESCSKHLEEVLRKNQRLRELQVSLKNPDDKTIEFLSRWIKHPEYKIKMIQETESLSRHCAEVVGKNQGLRELQFSFVNPDDKTMDLLCEELKHPQCKVETLRLVGVFLTESNSKHIAEILRKNQGLRQLALSLKNPNGKTMELLCNGLKHPECTIETLQLFGEFLTESCSRHLAEVLKKNQILRELDLTLENTGDKTMEQLWGALKHPECKIEMLRLNGKYIIQNGKWNEMDNTAVVESPASVVGGMKRLASFESLQSRKRRKPDRFQNS